MIQHFNALILTHKTARVSIREKVSLDETLIRNLLNFIGNYTAARDVMVLSTCNRTEIYYSSEEDVASIIFTGLTAVKSAAKELQNCFEQLRGVTAVGHLFEVSLGLDSQVLGDLQIIGQIKKAYQRSADEEMAGPFSTPFDAHHILYEQACC
jgi:glutamyl-tRNA reductase